MVQDKSPEDQPEEGKDILDLKAEPAPSPDSPDMSPDAGRENDTSSASAASTSEAPNAAPASPPPQIQRRQSTPAMIGAGILGGLIALAAAGSMQYAGYLPSTAPNSEQPDAGSDIEALRAEIDGLKQQLATIPADIAPTGKLEERIAALESRASDTSGGGDLTEVTARIAAVDERLGTLQQTATQGESAANQKIADLTTRLEAAEKTLREKPGEAAVSRAIAAAYLKAAVDRGDPYLTELETFASLSPDDPAIGDLRSLAATGVKSRADLLHDFDAVAGAIMDAASQPEPGEGFADRLWASARSLVSVRPVGNVEGNDAGAVLARLEDKLKNGDLKGASLEWEALPEAARKVSEAFKTNLDARVKADELTRGIAERSRTAAVQAG
ncbi:COG4223 family protein [Gellertiella hungarica]|uniref:Mitochondrial inner membrane protein n=1 Tax=Gellertiella hungarica TaxID=1572859 RepID=A0A7W6J5N6_9HYPH|nr:mitofilin family membrane protein [Gellertiella hungarica]MBB4065239.1 hypothetical protein [Gellertiella hungarica]